MRLTLAAFGAVALLGLTAFLLVPPSPSLSVTNAAGVAMQVNDQNGAPALKLLLPGQADSDPGILVFFPEHVTATPHGATEPKHLYLSASRLPGSAPRWERQGSTLT